MAELQLHPHRDGLNSHAQPQLWGKQIQEAPQCIALMAKCKLLLSKALLEGLEMSPNGPEHDSLLVLTGRFCRMGESTFRSSAIRMKAVGRLTHDMWKPGGTQATASDIKRFESELEGFEIDLVALTESKEALQSPFEGSSETNVPGRASPVVLASIIASTVFEFPLGPLLRLGSQWWVQSRIRRVEQQIGILNTVLGESLSENESLASCLSINNPKLQIAEFMEFLIGIQDIVAAVKDGDDRVLIKDLTAKDIDDMNDDPQLNKDYLRDVSIMKERLSIASRATELYNELSDKFILPAIDWVGKLSTFNLSDETYGQMELQINAKRLELSEGAKQLIMRRVAEIGIELKAQESQANVTELAEDISEEFEERVNT
ncbi:hypothetical protein FBULB1_4020 [Fusarium bulbicola]|nr:hypothetical protein FBULB1_4020 [Fusarium bulbicola]